MSSCKIVIDIDLLVHSRNLFTQNGLFLFELIHKNHQFINCQTQQLFSIRSFGLLFVQTKSHDMLQFLGIMRGKIQHLFTVDYIFGEKEGVVA